MPYIHQDDRLLVELNPVKYVTTPGDLNYQITMLCIAYMKKQGKSYQHINDVVGALEGAKMEFYRRYAAPYEDIKINQNGDVY
jgi:hypothetical protein